MKIEKSVQRIGWRLGQKKPFTPNQNDIEAYNEIVEYVVNTQKDQLMKNQLFGKLYIYVYGQFLRYYKATVFDEIPQKELHKLLDKPLRNIIEDFKDLLNNDELYSSIEEGREKDLWSYTDVSNNLKIQINAAINTFTK